MTSLMITWSNRAVMWTPWTWHNDRPQEKSSRFFKGLRVNYEFQQKFSNSFSSRILEYMIFSNLGSSRRQNQKSVFDWTSNNHIKYLKSKVACTLNVFGLFRNDSKVIRSKRFSKQFIRNCFLEHINQLKLSNLELLTWHHVI